MIQVDYDLTIGSRSIGPKPRRGDPLLIALRCALGVDLPAGRGVIDLALPSADAAPALGDSVTVKLDGGDGLETVLTGEVATVSWTELGIRVEVADALSKLARLEVAQAYQDKTAGEIVGDVLSQAQIQRGTVDDGPRFPSYVLHRGPRALAHLRRLAERTGRHLFTDGKGHVHFTAPRQGAADHTFAMGRDVLRLCVEEIEPPFDGAVVWGEGSGAGQTRAHWLAADLSNVRGEASIGQDAKVKPGASGSRPREITDGAVRSGEAARDLAEAWTRAAARMAAGFVEVPGSPQIGAGDLLSIDDLPDPASSWWPLPVRRVHHLLTAGGGFVTRLEV